MALKNLNVYNQSNASINQSYLGQSNGFQVQLFKNRFWEVNQQYWRLIKNSGFNGIMTENLALNFQTNWSDAGGAVLGKKIEGYANSKFIKMLAGQSDNGFKPFICSDAWTQQKVSGDAQPIKLTLKFKAYNTNRFGCTNYNDILRFLILICSPLKSSTAANNPFNKQIGDDLADTLNDAVAGGGKIVGTAIEAVKTFGSGDKSSISNVAKTFVETIDTTYKKLVAETGSGKNNGNFTVLFGLGDVGQGNKNTAKIIKRYIDTDMPEDKRYSLNIDWIITNFNFKPSRQFEMVEEGGVKLPKPLWMDFEVSLETRLSLSNRYVYDVIVPQALSIIQGA